MEDNNRINEENPVMIHGKPVQVGSFDEYHFCMPDTRYFDVADVLVLELSFRLCGHQECGHAGRRQALQDDRRRKSSYLRNPDFMEAGVKTCNLQMALDQKYTGKPILFDARERERMLFGHIGM